MSRRPYLFAGGRLVPLFSAPNGDGVTPTLDHGLVTCVECRADLADASWSAYCHLFRCACGSLYGLRFLERSAA